MKGLLFSVLLTLTFIFVAYEIDPKEPKCQKWEVVVKKVIDPKSKLFLTEEIAVCRDGKKG